MTTAIIPHLRRVELELAREPGHPAGEPDDRYILIAPIDDEGRIVADGWPDNRRHYRFVRETPERERGKGHIVHGPGGRWFLAYEPNSGFADETGFRFEAERFVPGEYVSIERTDGTHVYRVARSDPFNAAIH